ncbi:MAG: right-handed parallel beta-helix repeat-containing protein, partial [Armatimonadetes bacterium]|nr:right-handed parallel beta-helix repeat-containing protein [Armatimonadota bacterium]
VYELSETLSLGPADSGLTIRAAAGAGVVLRGGRTVRGWQAQADGSYLADLRTQELGAACFQQLFYKGQRQVLARYPNRDPEHPRTGGYLLVERAAPQPRSALVYQPGDLPRAGWEDLAQAELVSIYAGGWNYAITPLTGIDHERRLLSFRTVRGRFGRLNRFYLQNFPAALDAPGEWYHDRANGLLCFRTPDGQPPADEVVIPLVDHLVEVSGRVAYPHGYLHTRHRSSRADYPMPAGPPDQPVEDIHFQGLTLELARQDGLRLRGLRRGSVIGCTVRRVGGIGINLGGVASAWEEVGNPRLSPAVGEPMGVGGAGQDLLAQDPCQEVRVVGCDVSETGSDGIFLYGTGNLAENNHVHDIGLDDKDCAGINLFGEAHVARRNLVHDLPRNAIFLKGTDHLVELNDIHHTLLETCDGGAIRMCQRNLTLRGNVIRHNRIVDSVGYGFPSGANRYRSPYFTWGIYLDDFTCGTVVAGNLIVRTGRGGIHVHGGSDNLVEHNVVVDAAEAQIELNAIDDTAAGNLVRGNVLSYDAGNAALYRIVRPLAAVGRFADNLIWPRDGPVRVHFGTRRIEGWEAWLRDADKNFETWSVQKQSTNRERFLNDGI